MKSGFGGMSTSHKWVSVQQTAKCFLLPVGHETICVPTASQALATLESSVSDAYD